MTGELFGLGVWTEATWSDFAGESWVEVTAGGNYSLADGTLVMAEGFYNLNALFLNNRTGVLGPMGTYNFIVGK